MYLLFSLVCGFDGSANDVGQILFGSWGGIRFNVFATKENFKPCFVEVCGFGSPRFHAVNVRKHINGTIADLGASLGVEVG